METNEIEKKQKIENNQDTEINDDLNAIPQPEELLDNTDDNVIPQNDTAQDENDISMDELLKIEEGISEKLSSGELVYVKVVDVRSDYIYVDIGQKNEGLIPVKDFEGFKLPNIGTKIVAVLDRMGNNERNTILSYRKAKENITMKWLSKVFNAHERIKGRIVKQVKGGYIVSINGLEAFMPLSLSELGGAPRHYLPVNAKVKFYVIDFNPDNRKIIISRRAVLEEDEKVRREEILSQTKENDFTRVVVSKIVDNGIFVRYQGMEGFVRLEDVDWKNPKEEITKYARGQRIKVKIISVDKEKQRLYFGIKQTKPNPVELLRRRFPVRSMVKGKVVEVNDKGAKIHIVDDIYGIVNEEDYSYEGAPQKDEVIEATVTGVEAETYELRLSIKRYEQFENRKRIEQYSKQSPRITLGQLLKDENK
jgi:small subunit ribosomal protein S1